MSVTRSASKFEVSKVNPQGVQQLRTVELDPVNRLIKVSAANSASKTLSIDHILSVAKGPSSEPALSVISVSPDSPGGVSAAGASTVQESLDLIFATTHDRDLFVAALTGLSARIAVASSDRVIRKWIADDQAAACMRCNAAFTVTRRKHHCRACGYVACASCTPHSAVLAGAQAVRVCTVCFEDIKQKRLAGYAVGADDPTVTGPYKPSLSGTAMIAPMAAGKKHSLMQFGSAVSGQAVPVPGAHPHAHGHGQSGSGHSLSGVSVGGPERDQWGFRTDSGGVKTMDNDSSKQKQKERNIQEEYARQTKAWNTYIAKHPDFAPSSDLKRLVRGGVPPDLRGQVWPVLCGAKVMQAVHPAKYFQELVAKASDPRYRQSPAYQQIDKDLSRTFPTHVAYEDREGEGIRMLRRVLLAYSLHNPNVGYCQSLNFIGGLLLLFMDEVSAFWMLSTIVQNVACVPSADSRQSTAESDMFYYQRDLAGIRIDQGVFRSLVSEKLPRVSAKLEELNMPLEPLTVNWFLCLLINTMPLEITLRVWDCMFYEGIKVLFRASLTILKLNERRILRANSMEDLMVSLKSAATVTVTPDEFIETCYHFWIGSFPMSRITFLRQWFRAKMESEPRFKVKHDAPDIEYLNRNSVRLKTAPFVMVDGKPVPVDQAPRLAAGAGANAPDTIQEADESEEPDQADSTAAASGAGAGHNRGSTSGGAAGGAGKGGSLGQSDLQAMTKQFSALLAQGDELISSKHAKSSPLTGAEPVPAASAGVDTASKPALSEKQMGSVAREMESLLALGDSLVASRHAPSAGAASSAPTAASESTATPSPSPAPTPAAQPALPTPMSVAAVALGRDDDADSVGGVDDDQYDSEAEEHYQRRASTAANASLTANTDPLHATNAGPLEAQRLRGVSLPVSQAGSARGSVASHSGDEVAAYLGVDTAALPSRSRNRSSVAVKPLLGPHNQSISQLTPPDGERESGMVRATQASFWPQSKFGALRRTHSDANAIGGGDGASASSSASGAVLPAVSASSTAPAATAAGNDAAAFSSTPSDDSAAAPQVAKGSITEDPVALGLDPKFAGRFQLFEHLDQLEPVQEYQRCGQCGEVVPESESSVFALARLWHPQHFTCSHCVKPLVGGRYYVMKQRAYCEDHYKELFCRRCFRCNDYVLTDGIGAGENGPVYHSTCAACAVCGLVCTKDTIAAFYRTADGSLYCEKDYKSSVLVKCFKCSLPIQLDHEAGVKVNGLDYHQHCLRCGVCDKALSDVASAGVEVLSSSTADGVLYCSSHSTEPACISCGEPAGFLRIPSTTIHGSPIHCHCVRCRDCGAEMTQDKPDRRFALIDRQVYCEAHASKHVQSISAASSTAASTGVSAPSAAPAAAAQPPHSAPIAGPPAAAGSGSAAHPSTAVSCELCKLPIDSVVLSLNGRKYHQACVRCNVCAHVFPDGVGIYSKDDHFFCRDHYLEKFASKCAGCAQYLIEGRVVAVQLQEPNASGQLQNKYHSACFKCRSCQQPFPNDQYILKGQEVVCVSCAAK